MGLADGLLLSYYGDDFTGSTDIMEALSYAGVPTVLFVDPPTPTQLQRFSYARALGVAGVSRSLSTTQMHTELPPVFSQLKALNAKLCHYKTCSTFDSAPAIGNIGLAIEIAQKHFNSPFVPIVVGAPALQRFCVFGNLYARSGLDSEVFRLDRHPTMRQHPITPMDEADLRHHLARQTDASIGLFDVLQIELSPIKRQQAFDKLLTCGIDLVLFDVLTETHLARVGELIWNQAINARSLFSAGSSGLAYALTAYWRQAGWLAPSQIRYGATKVDQLVVVSGSCSPVTKAQIDHAVAHGFAAVELATSELVQEKTAATAIAHAIETGLAALAQGRSVILHTARGNTDPRLSQTTAILEALGYSALDTKLHSAALLGTALGHILKSLLTQAHLRRAVVTGGDTSAYVARYLGIEALEVVGPIAPGSPLCRIHASDTQINGMEITFKGGQVGHKDFFLTALRGTP